MFQPNFLSNFQLNYFQQSLLSNCVVLATHQLYMMACYKSLTNCINFIHKDDAGLMISCVVEHFSNEPSALSDVLVNNGTRYYLKFIQAIRTLFKLNYKIFLYSFNAAVFNQWLCTKRLLEIFVKVNNDQIHTFSNN